MVFEDLAQKNSFIRFGPLEAGPMIRRVLIVDGHPLIRLGVRRLLEGQNDLEVCGEAESVRGARGAIRDLTPDVIMMEINLKGGDGFELLRDIRARHPHIPLLILSMQDEATYAERMLSAGANGYITKDADSDQVLTALRCVLSGNIYATQVVSSHLIRRFVSGTPPRSADPIERLSNRELQILRMVGEGLTTRQIASSLVLSIKTVESHRQRVKRKLNLSSGAQLVRYAVRWAIGPRREVESSQPGGPQTEATPASPQDAKVRW